MYRAAKFVDNLLDPLSDSFPFHVISDYFPFSIFFFLMKWFSPAGDLAMSPAPSILLPDQLPKQFIAFSLSRPCFLPPNTPQSLDFFVI